jgi:nicotinate-nucleotide adenylyltransferase
VSARAIGLLTGTFDPIHLGHVELATAAMRKCGLDEVMILVNAKPAHKDGVLGYPHRLAMAELAVAGRIGMSVYDGSLAEWPHTMQTFAELMRRAAPNRLIFIVGMDTIARLDRWDDPESVVKNASFAVAQRPSASKNEVDELRVRLGRLGRGLNVRLFEIDDHALASSMDIREQLRAGLRPSALDERVYQYVLDHHLYHR